MNDEITYELEYLWSIKYKEVACMFVTGNL